MKDHHIKGSQIQPKHIYKFGCSVLWLWLVLQEACSVFTKLGKLKAEKGQLVFKTIFLLQTDDTDTGKLK